MYDMLYIYNKLCYIYITSLRWITLLYIYDNLLLYIYNKATRDDIVVYI